MNIHRLQHTSIPMPPGGNDEGRRFYADVIGLKEIPPPSSMGSERLVWFSVGDNGDELHLFVMEDFKPTTNGQHLCLVVHDLAPIRKVLEDAGFEIGEEPVIPFRPRFSVRDPFGNKIELTEIHGNYLDGQQ